MKLGEAGQISRLVLCYQAMPTIGIHSGDPLVGSMAEQQSSVQLVFKDSTLPAQQIDIQLKLKMEFKGIIMSRYYCDGCTRLLDQTRASLVQAAKEVKA